MKTMRLSELGEFGLIKGLRNKFKYTSSEILKGIGDDTAVIKTQAGTTLITADMMIEDKHFNLSYTTFYQLGHKILAVNISDIFAMGGRPRYFILSLGIPKTYTSKNIDELFSGIKETADKYRVNLVGGDTCATKRGLVLSGTLVGDAGTVITRSGARDGDGIFVTDTLVDSAIGLILLKKQKKKRIPASHQRLIRRHLIPEPRALKKTTGVTSMIDISDGLLADLGHICDESSVGAVIYKDKIPLSRELIQVAKKLNTDPFKFALKGGEDYVLLFTAPSDIMISAVRIGKITKKGRFLVDAQGRKTPFRAEGYEHFKI